MAKKMLAFCAVGMMAMGLVLLGSSGCDEGGAKITSGGGSPGASGAVAAPLPKGRPSDEVVDAFAKVKGLSSDDFEQMIHVLGLTDRLPDVFDPNNPPKMNAQEKAFRDNMAAWTRKFAEHAKSAVFTKAQEARKAAAAEKDPARKAELEKKSAEATKAERAAKENLRRIVMGPLTADQRMHWAQFVCFRNILKQLPGATLTPEQKDRTWALAGDPAKALAAMNYVATDPYLRGDKARDIIAKAVSTAYKTVLTDEQRKTVADPDAPKAPATPPAKPAKK